MIPAALAVAAAVIAALFMLLTPKPAHAQGLNPDGPTALSGVSPTARLPRRRGGDDDAIGLGTAPRPRPLRPFGTPPP